MGLLDLMKTVTLLMVLFVLLPLTLYIQFQQNKRLGELNRFRLYVARKLGITQPDFDRFGLPVIDTPIPTPDYARARFEKIWDLRDPDKVLMEEMNSVFDNYKALTGKQIISAEVKVETYSPPASESPTSYKVISINYATVPGQSGPTPPGNE